MLNPKCIEVFLSIVEHRSISAVAKNTYLSQPTVSEYLNQLEQLVGCTLILRGKGQRQIALTPAGEAFLPLAKKWMEHQNALQQQILQFRQTQPRNLLRLAASSGAHQHVASHIICKLLERCPGIQLQLCNVERREMPAAIENCNFDIAFMFGQAPENELVTHLPFFREDQYILCPANTQLPDRTLTPEDLDPEHLISYTSYRRSENFQQWLSTCFPGKQITPLFEASSRASIHHYLTDPKSWAVVPASIAITDISQRMGQLTYRKITPEPPKRTCSILISKAYADEKLVERFLDCCQEFIAERSYTSKL